MTVFDCDQFGKCTVQTTTTVSVTAKGDETHGELRVAVAALLPTFKYSGGLHRIRKGDTKPLGDDVYDFDRQALVVFVNHGPTGPLVSLG